MQKKLIVAGFAAILAVMITITSYSVTLYRMFCEATGAGGTTQRVARNDSQAITRDVTVFFDTSVAPNLPWRFVPVQRSVRVHLGEESLAFFTAENLSPTPIIGHATFNVTPEKVGLYFKKIQCFCFNEEKLAPGAKVQMPVTFFVDPRMAQDPDTADVHEITLSYTFFQSKNPAGAVDLSRFAGSAAEAKAGEALFAEKCSTCHALTSNKIGPALGTVLGRESGSVPGYPYSKALQKAGLVWTEPALETWLAGPTRLVPGAQMPMQVDSAQARRAIVRYLASLPRAPSQ